MSAKKKELTVRVEEEFKAVIEAVCAKRRMSVQEALEASITSWIGEQEVQRTREYLGFAKAGRPQKSVAGGAKS